MTVGRPNRPLVRRQRRLGAHHARACLRGSRAATSPRRRHRRRRRRGSRGRTHARADDAGAEQPLAPRRRDRRAHRGDGMGIFGTDVDVALGRADGDAGDRHAFDEDEGIALHDHAVGEGAAVALVGIADDVFLRSPAALRDRPPLDAGRKAGAAAAAQAGLHHLLDDRRRARARARAPARRSRHGAVVRRSRADRSMPQRAKVSRVWRLSHGISSARPRRKRVRPAVEQAGVEQAATSPASPGRRRCGPAGVATSTSGSSQYRPREPLRTISTSSRARGGRGEAPQRPRPRRRRARRHRAECRCGSSLGLGDERVEPLLVEPRHQARRRAWRTARRRRARGSRPARA